jgi:ABC-type antimicrobial peptide transport system ATPase subunit
METSGYHATHIDNWLGLPYHQLEQLSVREQRKIVKQRVEMILQERAQKYADNAMPLTRPIDNKINAILHRR